MRLAYIILGMLVTAFSLFMLVGTLQSEMNNSENVAEPKILFSYIPLLVLFSSFVFLLFVGGMK